MHQLTDVIVIEVIILCFVPDLLNVLKYTAITLGASLNYAFSATLTSITSGRRKYASPISSAHQLIGTHQTQLRRRIHRSPNTYLVWTLDAISDRWCLQVTRYA